MKTTYWQIYKIFFLIGLQLLGGGYVIIPILKTEFIEQRKWITEEELTDYLAMSQCLPGLIAANISVFIGYKMLKKRGAIAALAGMVAPSFIIIITLAHAILKIVEKSFVQNAFWGIRIGVVILILMTVRELWKTSVKDNFSKFIFTIMTILIIFSKISPAILVISSGLAGIIYNITSNKIKGNG